jgi:hypothetical protein
VKALEDLAVRWAERQLHQNASIYSSLFLTLFGCFNLGLYFFVPIDHTGLLGTGIFLLCIGLMLFERAGFVALIRRKGEKSL